MRRATRYRKACCDFGSVYGPGKERICADCNDQLDDFQAWLQQFQGKHIVLTSE